MLNRVAQRPLARALILGLLAALLADAPPLELATRLDRYLYDTYSGWAARAPPGDRLLVPPATPAELDALNGLARVHAPVAVGRVGQIFAWLLALSCVTLVYRRARIGFRGPRGWLAAGLVVLLLSASAGLFVWGGLWVPIAMPAVFAGVVTAARVRPAATDSGARVPAEASTPPAPEPAKPNAVPASNPGAGFPVERAPTALIGPREDPPRRLGRYEIVGRIGQGAMSTVYRARDPSIHRDLAIKVIDLAAEFDHGDLDDARQRFLREAATAGRLSHPNIVTIYDIGETDGLAYIAMEYLQGSRLSQHARSGRLLPIGEVLGTTALAADALHYAHLENVVHRDIKPANIMYDSASGRLKITDFGIARWMDATRTRTGVVLGTPSFMSPEQLEGKIVNGHTDLFALGVSLYELLTGQLPFRGTSMTELMFVIANEPHTALTAARPDLPRRLDALIDTALAKDPRDRFASGAAMAAALRAAAVTV
jgi:tRNA A-37 threonylcarbamoyl transferase component Bud32